MSLERYIWFKGNLVKSSDAKVDALSPTAQFGLNVFEGLRGYWSEKKKELFIYRLDDHLNRLFASCKLIGILPPYSPEEIISAIKAVVEKNKYNEDIALRVTIFLDGEGTWSSTETPDMFIAPIAKARHIPSYDTSLRASISHWQRIDDNSLPPRIKAGANYINGRYAQLDAQAAGFDIPILLDRSGKVSEAPGACIMMVRDGRLVTPPASSSILESITCDSLLNFAKDADIETEIRVIDKTELYIADELFLCGSAAEVLPLRSVDRFIITEKGVGEITKAMSKAYLSAATNDVAKYSHWNTPIING